MWGHVESTKLVSLPSRDGLVDGEQVNLLMRNSPWSCLVNSRKEKGEEGNKSYALATIFLYHLYA